MEKSESSILGFLVSYMGKEFKFYDKVVEDKLLEEETVLKTLSETEVINRIFIPEQRDTPYIMNKDYQRDWIAFISLCLANVVAYKSYCLQTLSTNDFVPSLSHTFMGWDEAMHHITCSQSASKLPILSSGVLTEAYSYIQSRELATQTTEYIPRVMHLKQVLGLSHFSEFSLQCALAYKLSRACERVFKGLQGDDSIVAPTLGIIQTLYTLSFSDENDNRISDSNSLENRLLFKSIQDDTLMRPLTLRSITYSYIMGKSNIIRELQDCIIDLPDEFRTPLHIDKQLQEASKTYQYMLSRTESIMCVLSGETGSGRKLTLQWLAKNNGAKFILINLDKLSNNPHYSNMLDELLFLALVETKVLCFVTEKRENQIQEIADKLKSFNLGIFLLIESEQPCVTPYGYLAYHINYPPQGLQKSSDFWEIISKQSSCPLDIDWKQISAKYTLTTGQIESILHNATIIAKFHDSPITEDMISEIILRENTAKLGVIANKIELFYSWDDLILDEIPKMRLSEVCNRIKHRYTVEIEWGGKSAYGNGVSVLLYGPPGTGKTMAAQVVAKELGLPLYRIDLSQIISKYVGETAKNINAVFEEAKKSNIILFFDEADALFAKRTDVNNSNDRHANTESSYLLQRIEDYSGISILASNLSHTFDEAFRRRINYMINIKMPNEEQRLALWKQYIPPNAPIEDDVNLGLLARNLELSGSVIKAAAIQSAYFAATDNSPINMMHLTSALRLELQKLGKSEPMFLLQYK